ncbi:MAG: hypothetical protein IAE82_01650 [Opitutaceae bacterium]|nr:hypothetical protein [Opitutaceae bacterium]
MTSARLLLIFATGACLAATAASAADSTTPAARPRRAGPPPTPEMIAYHEQVMAIYDADKNGVLDETERAVLKDDIDAGTMQPPPMPPGGRGRHMGPPPEILATYDTDRDGTLSETERAALEADIAAGKLPPPPPPPGACPPAGDGTSTTTPAAS